MSLLGRVVPEEVLYLPGKAKALGALWRLGLLR